MSSIPSGFSAFFAELRRRRVFRVAAVYAVVAWLIVQIAATTFPHLNLPDWMITGVIVVVALGFPIALVLAWAFDLTPEGVVRAEPRQQAKDADASPLRWTGQRIAAVGGIAILALAGGAFILLGGSLQRASAAVEELDRSVAVLPFVNLSADQENEYFSDGITDEILTTLASVRHLRVISRTSVMRYKTTDKSLREIADELGVAHILAGSVQRTEGRVRINAQLIDAGTDAHLWAQRYDRPLEDIFAVQSEIAQQIVRALQAELSPAERNRIERQPSANLTAYDYVLRAREHLQGVNVELALGLLRQARELDPRYPDAHAALSEAFALRGLGDRMWLDSAVVAARGAIELDPHFARGYARLGVALDYLGDRDAALEAHRRSLQLNPQESSGLANLYTYSFGQLDEAARWWRPALEADPANAFLTYLAGRTYVHLGMPERGRQFFEKALALQPEFMTPYYHLGVTYVLEGRPEEAAALIQRVLPAVSESAEAHVFAGRLQAHIGDLPQARHHFAQALSRISGRPVLEQVAAHNALLLAWHLEQSGEVERAHSIVRSAAAEFEKLWGGRPRRPEDFVNLARVRVLEGDREGALQLMEEAVRQGWRLYNENPGDPILGSLRGDPRFERLVAEIQADIARMRERVEREGW
jgi:adenylate cyclase